LVYIGLWHAKAAGGDTATVRVGDLQEVITQAIKSNRIFTIRRGYPIGGSMTTTEQLRDVWQLVDFNPLAARNIVVGELLVRAVDVHSGERVLDVAAGTGNTALAAEDKTMK
jgi:hypothetical protein